MSPRDRGVDSGRAAHPDYEIRLSELLARLATTLIHRPDTPLSEVVDHALGQIAAFVGADRGYIFLYDFPQGRAVYSHEWCAPGISPQLAAEAVVDTATLGEWVDLHRRGEPVVVEDVQALGDRPIRRVLEHQQILSTAMVPMLQEGECIGFCGFDAVRRQRDYSGQELRLLQVFAQMLVNLWLHEETRQRLQQLSDIVELSPAVAVVWRNEPGWPLEYASDNIRQLGYTAEEFIAGEILYSDLIHPDDLPAIEAAVAAHVHHGPDEYRQTYRLYRRDGSYIWIDDHTWLVRDDHGEVQAIHGILMDDSARKQAEIALASSEQRFRRLLEDIPNIAVQGYDRDLRLIFWNRGSELIYGWKAEEAIGQSLLDLIIPETLRDDVERGALRWLSGGPAVDSGELTLQRRDGSAVSVYSSHALQVNSRGECEMYCIDIDMTAQRAARARLELWASVFTHSHEAIFILDGERRIVEINAAFTAITGYDDRDALGRPLDFLVAGAASAARYEDMWRALSEQGFWTGELPSRRSDGGRFEAFLTVSAIVGADGGVANLVGLFSDITAQKHYQQQLEYTAFYDALTGLANRTLLADRLRQAMSLAVRRGQPVAVCFIDLDGFKSINDTYGHSIGDGLLVAAGARLRSLVRESDTVSRMGGDEFVLLLLDLPESGVLDDFFTRLAMAMAEPIEVGGHSLRVSASMGVSFFPQGDVALDADQLLRQADQAMYEAKHAGKNRVVYFDSALDETEKQRRRHVDRLSRAIDNNELLLHYQPKVDLRAGVTTGVEALVRWQHPEQGLLAPGEFLHLAVNEDRLAVKLGEWVLRQALDDFAGLYRDLPDVRIGLSVNLDAVHLLSGDFAGRLAAVMSQHRDLPDGVLRLEVLESSLIPDMDQAVMTMEKCRGLGVRFALDDFGTGYSSLHYLKILPLDEIKIDAGFVRDMLTDPDDLAIVRGVIDLGEAFGIDVVAEGVETADHAALLLRLGCAAVQGYGIARPMPIAELHRWIFQWRPDPTWTELAPVNTMGAALLHAEVRHRAWIAGVQAYLSGRTTRPPPLDEADCRFTTWIEALPDSHLSRATLTELRRLHRRVHVLAQYLCAAFRDAAGLLDAGALAELEDVSERLRSLMQNLLTHAGMLDGGAARVR
ncbi:EAL domain-containing protein [Chromatocurvus halotolerans]|uniref:PAS domain S-box-containing protein/diguanylate cyclase (GGDEF)-like protein n=1 Tax=Chromatocurvus halotolerans TaxID=1132028 RepID=A0A4R2KX41_9GAMM|nr:EAL domain-containing protein [Chromatocurvus halotolerans]TCO75826.1 PAS domain S-box-containing protein/diguanylate cyclase (GGDEF)-like protein [Chromatocurvus halotolerans]